MKSDFDLVGDGSNCCVTAVIHICLCTWSMCLITFTQFLFSSDPSPKRESARAGEPHSRGRKATRRGSSDGREAQRRQQNPNVRCSPECCPLPPHVLQSLELLVLALLVCFCLFRQGIEKLLQRLHAQAEEQEYFVDKRIVAQMIAKHQQMEVNRLRISRR